MKLNAKALGLTAGLLWAAAIVLVSVANMIWPPYGGAFLNVFASVYPGFDPAQGGLSILFGGVIGFIDGFIAGFIFAWLYNRIAG